MDNTLNTRLRSGTIAPQPRPLSTHIRALLAVLVSVGIVASGLTASSGAAVAAERSAVAVGTLEVENRTEPLGIDVERPRFSWITNSVERDVQQQSYRIRVSDSAATLPAANVWDSGVVDSNESVGVEFEGTALLPATDYYWQVDVVTTAGTSSAASQFGTGLMDDADWAGSAWIGRDRAAGGAITDLTFPGASWIWTPEANAPIAPAEDRAFRRTIQHQTGKIATRGEILITADDSYTVWVNGALVGKTAGNENEWQASKLYRFDLTGSSTVIAIRTTNGAGTPAGLLAAVELNYSDKSRDVITTDAAWKAIKMIPSGFEARAFDDSGWGNAAVHAVYGSGPWGSGVRGPTAPTAAAPLLRTEFDVAKTVASAKAYVAAGGYANVSLNGAPINDEILSPGFTDYDDHAQYTVTDVTDQLQAGPNALGLELGRGFYGMTNPNVWNWDNPPFHDEPVGRILLRIEYTDGTYDDVVTNNDWSLHDGPTLIDDLYGGETYDANRVQTGFDTVGFDDTSWVAASEVDGPGGILINQQQQPIRITEELPAESITEPAPGIFVVKFPRVIAGTVKFTAQGNEGETIRAQYGEKLKSNNRPNFSNNGGFANGFQTDNFILAGTGEPETWSGKFSYKGFQYIEVTGWPGGGTPPLSAFTAQLLHTDAPETGSFDSSSPVMNQTHRAVVDTLINNIHSIPTDTPMFEKNGWTGDAAVGAEMFLMNLDTQNLFEKWIGDIHDSRDADGAPLVIAPSSGQWGQWGVAPPWHSAYVLIPWWLYQYGDNTQVLETYYDGMKTYVDLEYGRSPGGVVPDSRLGDWVSPEASPAGGNAPEDVRVSATAYLYTMITTMQKTATVLGKDADALAFAAQAEVVKAGFNDAFLDADAGLYRGSGDRGYRQTHNVLALAFGLAPDAAMAQRVADSVAADVIARGDTLNTGSLGSKYLLPMLTKFGHSDVAFRVAVQTAYPSWGFMIENGATTMWEHWSLEARSRGHYFLGTVDDWFFNDVAGIRSSELTGYRDITIKPAVTEQMEWANATTQTPFGPVTSDWRNEGDTLTLATHVPVGSSAVVHLPARNQWAVTEGGQAVSQVAGVRSVSQSEGSVAVTIGSGDYEFVVNAAAGELGDILDRLDDLQTHADARLADTSITGAQHGDLSAQIDDLRSLATTALDALGAGDSDATVEALTDVISGINDLDEWLNKLDSTDDARADLLTASDAVRTAVEASVTDLLGVVAAVRTTLDAYKPLEKGTFDVSVSNTGTSTLGAVSARIVPTEVGVDESWKIAPDAAALADTIAPESSATAALDFTVPEDIAPGDVAASVVASYEFAGVQIRVFGTSAVTVDSPVVISSAQVDPATVHPGETTTLTATVSNTGSAPTIGQLAVSVPSGWVTPLLSETVTIAAGAEATVSIPVFVPLDATQLSRVVSLEANFMRDSAIFATATAELTIALATIPQPNAGYDHVDLGASGDEQAHNLTASSSSGTNTEAGLTRRYAGHLTDFSYFEFDTKIVAGEPFMIRAVETYDRAQIKKYRIYVDGEVVHTRLFSHTSGLGTETYEFLVDAAYATDSTVRIRFENLDDHSYYDPSIADVWTLAVVDDTTAPQVVARTEPSAPNRDTGWFTQAPVQVTIDAQDDRDPAPLIDVVPSVGDSPESYETTAGPFMFTDDGVFELSYQARDSAGNATEPATATVQLDTEMPVTSAELGAEFDGASARGSGTIRLEATDATSGVQHTEYRLTDSRGEHEWMTLASDADSLTVSESGAFTLDYRSTDVAGNRESYSTISGTIVAPDVTAPTIDASVSNPGDNGWNLAGAQLTLTSEDAQSGVDTVEYRIDGEAWIAYEAPVALEAGSSVVQYRATDAEGNMSAVGSLQIKVDDAAPTAWGWLSLTGRVSMVATDAGSHIGDGSGVAGVDYSLDGDTWVRGLAALIARDGHPSQLMLRPVDRAGNVGEVVSLEREETPQPLTVAPSIQLLIEASGFAPGSTIRLELHSEITVLGTTVADSGGVIGAFVTVPAGFELGTHSLVFADADGDSVVIPTEVAFTGSSSPMPWILLSLVLVALGSGAWLFSRSRRAS